MDLTPRRLRNQQLVDPDVRSAHALVRHFGAVQGQEYGHTKWGLGLRLPGVSDGDVERQLDQGKLLRTHVIRPTWHFVAREDIRWLLDLTGPRVHQLSGFSYRSNELDARTFRGYNRLIAKALVGRRELSRDELKAVFAQHKVPLAGVRLGLVMLQAELAGIVCSGVRRGNSHTYALLDDRVPVTPPKSRDEALSELTRRYFRSRGPATANDFATWSALTLTDCRRGIDMWRPKLAAADVDGKTYFAFRDTPSGDVPDALHLLPIYDEYVMGYKDRSAMLGFRKRTGTPPFRFDSMIVRRGEIIGTWRRDIGKRSIDLVWDFFRAPEKRELDLLDHAAERFGEFHGLPVSLHRFDPADTSRKYRSGWIFSNAT